MNTLSVENVGAKTRQSIKWSFFLQIIQKIFFLAGSIVLARLLTPHDFGLATMAMTFDMIIWLISSSGITSSIIYFQDNVEERLDTVFWLFIVSMTFFIGIQIALAPAIANFYKSQLLADIIRLSAVALFISCFGSIQKVILFKNMEFKKTSILECVLNIIKSILYVVLALSGYGVWSFIYPKIVVAVIFVISIWNMSSWRPKLRFNLKYWAEMFNYGKNVLFSNLIDYFLNNSSYILIGGFMGSTLLGFYTFAYDKSMMVVNNIAYPVTMISFPAFSKLQNHREKLKEAFFKTVKFISFITFPCTMGQILLAPEYITTVFGSKWQNSIVIFQLILVYSMFRSVSQCGTPVLQGVGKASAVLKWNLIYAPVFILSLYLGYKSGGIYGVGLAASLVGSIGAFIYMLIVIKELKWSFNDLSNALKSSLISSIIMTTAIFALREFLKHINTPDVIILATVIPSGILVYILCVRIFFKETYQLVADNLMKFLDKKQPKPAEA